MQFRTPFRLSVLSFLFALLTAIAGLAQTPATFSLTENHSGIYAGGVVGDLNNDGREDIVSLRVMSPTPGFDVVLANGDGTYAAPVPYYFPQNTSMGESLVLADVNSDGKLDVLVSAGTAGYYEYLNNGDGTFHLQATFLPPGADGFYRMAVGDFNHDGRPDLVINCHGQYGGGDGLCVYFSNPDGGFGVGPRTAINESAAQDLLVGDFDGDGKADVATVNNGTASSTTVDFWYGDGAGNFQEVGGAGTDSPQVAYAVGDIDGDGKTDLVGSPMGTQPNLIVYYGNAARTQEHSSVPLSSCAAGYKPAVADFNGDGIPDFAVVQMNDCTMNTTDWPHTVVVKYGQGNRSFGPESRLSSSTTQLYDMYAVRANQDSKPDLLTVHYTGSNPETDIDVWLNTTTGSTFPSCLAPVDAAYGINICSPGASTSTTAVHFGIAAGTQTQARKVEVWVDGTKAKEQFAHAFSHYAFMDQDLTLTSGNHTIDVYAAGVDNWVEHTSFTVNVGSTSGGGSSGCGQPTTPGVSICSPIAGGTYPSPVQISAAGRNSGTTDGMDVWLDGHKVGYYSGTSVNISVPAADGAHQLDIYAVGTNGELQEATVKFNVGSTTSGGGGTGGTGGSGTCTAPSSPGVNICSPPNGATVTSPVQITAAGRNSGTTDGMDVWLDGNKVGWYGGTNSVNFSLAVASGNHELDVYAVGTNGELQLGRSMFTVGTSTTGGGGTGGTGGGTSGTCPGSSTVPAVFICSPPPGGSTTSPFDIHATAYNVPSNTSMDVWIDGVKYGWYPNSPNLVITGVAASVGKHQLDIYAVQPDGTKTLGSEIFTVTSTTTSGGGGTSTCTAPSTPGVTICSPLNGSTVSSPVQVTAYGRNSGTTSGMDVWLDGQKVGWYTGTSVNISVPNVGAGKHQLDIYAVGTNGELQESTVVFNVQ